MRVLSVSAVKTSPRTVEAGHDVDRDDHEDALDRAGEDAEEEDLASQLSVTLAAQH